MIPLFCDLAGKRVVICGGGAVALRKARRLAREATVTVHAPAFHAGFSEVGCELVHERVDTERARELFDGEGVFLAVVATDDAALNARLTAIARERGCLVNRVDRPNEDDAERGSPAISGTGEESTESDPIESGDPVEATGNGGETGDVIVPSTIEAGELTVAISTGGSSPAMAKHLRRRFEPILEEAAPMVRLQRDLRTELKRAVEGSDERRERLWAVIESEAVRDALAAGDEARAQRLARERAGLSE